jgi:lysophospholipase L1-like esterase
MKPTAPLLAFVLSLGSAFAADVVYTAPSPVPANPCAYAAPRDDWYKDVQNKFTKYGNKPADIVFEGDSITNRWEGTGKPVWDKYFAGRSADFGIEGDRTENVLWRLSKNQVAGVNPKVVVIMIGTNNSGRDSAENIAGGVKAIVEKYEELCPQAHIILMAIFPRGNTPDNGGRIKVEAVNKIIKSLASDRVSYVDIGPKLLQPDGTMLATTAPDFVHPTEPGYVIWADAIMPIVNQYAPAGK